MKPDANKEVRRIYVKSILRRLQEKWQLFAFGASFALLIGIIYLLISTPIYQSALQLLVDETSIASEQPSLTPTQQNPEKKNIQNEIGFLQSRGMIRNTLAYLGFQVSLWEETIFGKQEVFSPNPFKIVLDENHPQLMDTDIELEILSADSFRLWVNAAPAVLTIQSEDRQQHLRRDAQFSLNGAFGVFTDHEYLRIMILTKETDLVPDSVGERPAVWFRIHDLGQLSNEYGQRLAVAHHQEKGSIVELTMKGNLPEKDKVFLTGLAHQYIDHEVSEKNRLSQGTIDFIDAQLTEVSDSLEENAAQITDVRRGSAARDLRITGANAVPQLKQFQAQRSDLQSRLAYYEELERMLANEADPAQLVSPSNLGIDEPMIAEAITELKRQYSEKVIKSVASGEESLEIQSLNRQIQRTQRELLANVQMVRSSTEEALGGLRRRISQLQDVVKTLPGNEQFLDRMERKFAFNDDLYNYLMKRRMEAEMAKSESKADSRVLDPAHIVGDGPVEPHKGMVLLKMFAFGLLLPFFYVLIQSLLNNTVMEVQQIEKKVNAPLLGHILHAPLEVREGNLWADETALAIAENFRYLFVNLDVMQIGKPCKVISMTSTIPDEGKTFCAVNLAQIMAASGKKVLIIGADIRKPRMHKQLFVPNRSGLTNYLSGQLSLLDVLQDTSISSLKCITSGPVPVNPAELLDSETFPELIAELEPHFDYIIIDTPPAGLFADFLQVSRYTDLHLYVVRQRYSKLTFLDDIEQLRQHANLKRFFLVFNDIKYGNGYRTKYGYEYGYRYRDPISMQSPESVATTAPEIPPTLTTPLPKVNGNGVPHPLNGNGVGKEVGEKLKK